MSSLVLVTGGSRSGKSAFAQQMVESGAGPRLFLATCLVSDSEMAERIKQHQQQRQGGRWETLEETCHLAEVLRATPPGTQVLIDCLSLWVSNLMAQAAQAGQELDEAGMAEQSNTLAQAAQAHKGQVVLVTNEVGLGIVPEHPVSRRFRDLLGRCNQLMAAQADAVFFVCCGIPIQLK